MRKIKRKKKKPVEELHSGRLNRCLDCDAMWNSGNKYYKGFPVKNETSPTATDEGFIRSSGPFVSSDTECVHCGSENVVENGKERENEGRNDRCSVTGF